MGYVFSKEEFSLVFQKLKENYLIFAPKVFSGSGCYSDTDVVRYGEINDFPEIEYDRRSDYSFKESIFAINETLFYFTEDETTVPKCTEKDLLIFVRPCDMHALKRLDTIYLKNGPSDFYYERLREKAHFVMMGCMGCESGFCVSMGTNTYDNYDIYIRPDEGDVFVDVKDGSFGKYFDGGKNQEVSPVFATKNAHTVVIPEKLSVNTFSDEIWEEYGARCIGCGRCNFVCPTCTCFTMQDIHYKDNPKNGERRRVHASCMVDGFTDIAGGGSFRKTKGQRLRFRVMHKIYDYKKRFGEHMCIGCGRCEDVCPEYISFVNIINRLNMEETK